MNTKEIVQFSPDTLVFLTTDVEIPVCFNILVGDYIQVGVKKGHPVLKFVNLQKEEYRKKKRLQGNKKIKKKSYRLSPVITDHDISVKVKQAKKHISKGNQVCFILQLRQDYLKKNAENVLKKVSFFFTKVELCKSEDTYTLTIIKG